MSEPKVFWFYEADEYVVDEPDRLGLDAFVSKSEYDEILQDFNDCNADRHTATLELIAEGEKSDKLEKTLKQAKEAILSAAPAVDKRSPAYREIEKAIELMKGLGL